MKTNHFIVLAMVAVLSVPSIAKKSKTVEYKDNVLTDLRYNYQLDVPKNWKVKKFKEKSDEPEVLRTLLIQKNYQINHEARDLDADFTIPEIQIYTRVDTIDSKAFMEKIKSDVSNHSSEDNIINQLNLILTGEFLGQQTVEINDLQIEQAYFKRQWKRVMEGDPDDPKYRQYGGRIVRNVHDVHEVYVFKHNGCLFVIQVFVENEFHAMLKEEIATIISSIRFIDSETSTENTEN